MNSGMHVFIDHTLSASLYMDFGEHFGGLNTLVLSLSVTSFSADLSGANSILPK